MEINIHRRKDGLKDISADDVAAMEGEEKKDADPAAIYGVDDKEKTSDRITRYSEVKGSNLYHEILPQMLHFWPTFYFSKNLSTTLF